MSSVDLNANIFALSTPVGGAIALLRASGNNLLPILKQIFSGKIETGKMNYGHLIDPESGKKIDSCMVSFFKSPHSYTGEDVFELNLHGSYAIVRAAYDLLHNCGMREAQPGEFTKRAFVNGKIDLVQADAVMDLVLSDTERSRKSALEQLDGGLSKIISELENMLIALTTELSAAMDYPDEMEEEVLSNVDEVVSTATMQLDKLINSAKAGRILRSGAKVVILGNPNAGKSSLMNILIGSSRAIVTDIAGTTRDTLEEKIDIFGYPIRLIDTAGLHETDDIVEKLGIERALNESQTAELILRVIDADENYIDDVFANMHCDTDNVVFVVNKCDLNSDNAVKIANRIQSLIAGAVIVITSCKTGKGIEELKRTIISLVAPTDGESNIVTNERHLACLKRARRELYELDSAPTVDLKAMLLDSALIHLGEITGRTAAEEVLDGIFKRFCVGK